MDGICLEISYSLLITLDSWICRIIVLGGSCANGGSVEIWVCTAFCFYCFTVLLLYYFIALLLFSIHSILLFYYFTALLHLSCIYMPHQVLNDDQLFSSWCMCLCLCLCPQVLPLTCPGSASDRLRVRKPGVFSGGFLVYRSRVYPFATRLR